MASPKYFENFPNIKYSVSANRAGKLEYINIKDYFRTAILKEEFIANKVLYKEYVIKNGERPEQISYEQYGDEQYYWVILQVNNIVDVYNEWPLSQYDLEKHIENKYGVEGAGDIHHWETVETLDTEGNLMCPAGLVVNENYIFYYNDAEGVTLSSLPVGISNRQYELRVNEQKERIQIMDPKYVYDYLRDMKNYAKNLDSQVSEISISELY